MDIKEQERIKYEKMWSRDEYRRNSPGERLLKRNAMPFKPGDTVADLGCGTGRASEVLKSKGCQVVGVDHAANCLEANIPFVTACLWDLPDLSVDWFFSCDVMEHIPEDMVEKALSEAQRISRNGGVFSICFGPDGMGRIIGEKLHLTVKPLEWWRSKIDKFWNVEVKDDVFFCTR